MQFTLKKPRLRAIPNKKSSLTTSRGLLDYSKKQGDPELWITCLSGTYLARYFERDPNSQ